MKEYFYRSDYKPKEPYNVGITLYKSDKHNTVGIRLLDDAADVFGNKYVVLALDCDEKRLYIEESTITEGYKASRKKSSKTNRAYITSTNTILRAKLKKLIGGDSYTAELKHKGNDYYIDFIDNNET